MTLNDVIARAAEVEAEIAELTALDELDGEQEERFDALVAETSELADKKERLEARAAAARRVSEIAQSDPEKVERAVPNFNKRDTDDVYDLSEVRAFGDLRGELRGRAMRAIEKTDSWEMSDNVKEVAASLIERKDDSRGSIARRILATGSDDYKRAWAKAVTGRDMLLTDKERSVLQRAASLTDASGGFAVPFPIDPTLIQQGDGSSNPFRRISRVETITTDSWQGIASSQVTASWDGEAGQVSDDTPTWAQPQVVAEKAQAFVPASIEITEDYPNLVGDLTTLLVDAKDRLEATAFATGAGGGSDQPVGIVTALDGSGNDISTATTDTFAVADVYTVHETLGPRYRDRATWVANVAIINDIRQFGTADGHTFSSYLTESAPMTILGRPIVESSAMDGAINAMAENNILVFGDFSNYLIADRVGFSLEFIPHLFATADNRPSGQRGWYAYWRVGADSVNDDAFVLLNAT